LAGGSIFFSHGAIPLLKVRRHFATQPPALPGSSAEPARRMT
jgi:hypothetical protein